MINGLLSDMEEEASLCHVAATVEMCQVLRNEVRGQKFYQHQRIKVPIN